MYKMNHKSQVMQFRKYHEDPIQYLETYFKLAYYLCAAPFRFEEIQPIAKASLDSRGVFVLKKWLPQQVLYYTVNAWCLYKYIPSIYATKFNYSKISSFDAVALLTSFGVRTSFIYMMTTKQKDILSLFNTLRENQLSERKAGSNRSYRNGKIQWLVGALTLAYVLIGVVYTVSGIGFTQGLNWDPKEVWASLVGQARFNVFLRDRNNALNFTEITTADHVGTVLYFALRNANLISSHFVGNAFLIMSLLFHHLARDFQNLIKKSSFHHQREGVSHNDRIISKFWKLRYLINEKVHNIYGAVLLFWMMEGVLYYSCYLDSIFNEKNHFNQFRNIIYLVNFMSVLLLASDAHYKISGMKDWIIQRQQQILMLADSDLIVILNTLSPCEVGIKAFGFFTITYEFLGTLTHVIITYAVILLNFQDGKPVSFYGYNNIL